MSEQEVYGEVEFEKYEETPFAEVEVGYTIAKDHLGDLNKILDRTFAEKVKVFRAATTVDAQQMADALTAIGNALETVEALFGPAR